MRLATASPRCLPKGNAVPFVLEDQVLPLARPEDSPLCFLWLPSCHLARSFTLSYLLKLFSLKTDKPYHGLQGLDLGALTRRLTRCNKGRCRGDEDEHGRCSCVG